MRTDSANLTSGTTAPAADGEKPVDRSRFTKVAPWLVRGLVFGTSVAVASYSWWLIPPYLAVMAFLLLEPAGRRVNATNPAEPVTNKTADANRAGESSDLVDETSLDPGKAVAEASAAGSTAVKTRRASKARTKKIRQVPELTPASWIQVAPGKFVRVEPGTEIPRDESAPEPTTGEAVEESLAAPLAAEPIESAPEPLLADEEPEAAEDAYASEAVSNEAASEMGDTLADHLPQPHVTDFESDQPLTSDDDLPPDAVDPSPTADTLNETASDIEAALESPVVEPESDETPADEAATDGDEPLEADEFAEAAAEDFSEAEEFQDVSESYAADAANVEAPLESPVENDESDEAEADESVDDGDEPAETDEFVEAVATSEFSDADEFEEVHDERAADDAAYEAEADETGDEPVDSTEAEYPAEPVFDNVSAAEEEPVAVVSDPEASDVAEDEESDEAYAESDAETTEFHDEAVARDADVWNDEIIDEEAEVDRSEPGVQRFNPAEASLEPLGLHRPVPPSRGNVRSARAHRLPTGFRRRSPRGVGRQRQLIRAFPPRSPP